MSAHFEHTGPFPLRRHVARLLLSILALAPASAARSQCPSPLIHPLDYRSDGTVELRWVHPQYFGDTVRAHLGGYQHPFIVSEAVSDNRVAIKLPSRSTATMLHAINAYFVGKAGVSEETWSIHGAFSWSLHADSQGVPGNAGYPKRTWLIGDSASLQSGGWFRDTVNWWLPDTAGEAGFWLVGHWPDLARKVVRLGADGAPCPVQIMAGYSDGTGLTWVSLVETGLLIDVELLHSQPVTNEAVSPTSGFSIVRELLSGPLSPCTDSVILTPGEPFVWHDSLPIVGQVLRYGITPPCSSGTTPFWTSDFVIPGRWPVAFSPESLTAQIRTVDDTALSISIVNQGSESLLVTLEPAELTSATLAFLKTPTLPLSLIPDPDSLILAPGETRAIRLTVPITGLSVGTYTSWLIASIRTFEGPQAERRTALIRFDVDLATSVDDQTAEDRGIRGSPPGTHRRDARVSARQNPFGDRIELEFEVEGAPQGSTRSLQVGRGTASAEVTVCNALGRIVKHQMIPIRLPLEAQMEKTLIVIEGTHHWPSGVYLVSVRCGTQEATAKLLHLK